MVKTADQVAQLAFENGLKVSPAITRQLIPTPTVSDTFTGNLKSSQQKPGSMHSVTLPQLVTQLLPTPMAQEGTKATAAQGSEQRSQTGQVWLTNIAYDIAVDNGLPVPVGQFDNLLGTPRTVSGKGSTKSQVELQAPKSRLEDQVLTTGWGRFEPAIRQWEQVTGRPSPAPTKPDGKHGAHRLSSEFTEWMMGLPKGWLTGIGLSRNEELKACGNGVVPQQAALALSILDPIEETHNG